MKYKDKRALLLSNSLCVCMCVYEKEREIERFILLLSFVCYYMPVFPQAPKSV